MNESGSSLPGRLCAAGLLAVLVACGSESSPQATRQTTVPTSRMLPDAATSATAQAEATRPADKAPPMMPGRIHAPTTGEVACPSQDFESFLHAFLNSGDLQVRYTAKPRIVRLPYHDHHNTEPGDPANPQWATYESDRPMHDRYRYDARSQRYISDSSRLRPGQVWTGIDAEGHHISNPIADLQVRKVSDTEYAVDTGNGFTRSRITTFTRREDCWYLTQDWSLDPFEGCFWPDQCRDMQEYEAPYFDDETDPGRVEAYVGRMMEVIAIPRVGHGATPGPVDKDAARSPSGKDSAPVAERRIEVPAPVAGVIGARDDGEGVVEIVDRPGGEVLARFRNMRHITVEVGDRIDYGQTLGNHANVAADPVFLRLEMSAGSYPQFRRYADDLIDGRLPRPSTKSKAGDGNQR